MRLPEMPLNSTAKNGFTLLEVLVALVILGLALAFLTSTISSSLLRTERIAQQNRAATLADSILSRLGRDIPLHPGIAVGADPYLRWTLSITPLNSNNTIDQIDLTISSPVSRPIGHWQTLRIVPQPASP